MHMIITKFIFEDVIFDWQGYGEKWCFFNSLFKCKVWFPEKTEYLQWTANRNGLRSIWILTCFDYEERRRIKKKTDLSLRVSVAEVNDNIAKLKSNTNSINSDQKEILPPVAYNRHSIPSEKQAIQQCNYIRSTWKLLRTLAPDHPSEGWTAQ